MRSTKLTALSHQYSDEGEGVFDIHLKQINDISDPYDSRYSSRVWE